MFWSGFSFLKHNFGLQKIFRKLRDTPGWSDCWGGGVSRTLKFSIYEMFCSICCLQCLWQYELVSKPLTHRIVVEKIRIQSCLNLTPKFQKIKTNSNSKLCCQKIKFVFWKKYNAAKPSDPVDVSVSKISQYPFKKNKKNNKKINI